MTTTVICQETGDDDDDDDEGIFEDDANAQSDEMMTTTTMLKQMRQRMMRKMGENKLNFLCSLKSLRNLIMGKAARLRFPWALMASLRLPLQKNKRFGQTQ